MLGHIREQARDCHLDETQLSRVAAVMADLPASHLSERTYSGINLRPADFPDQTLGPNTGTLSAGDSGGGVFIFKNGAWQLAGVHFATDGPYNTLPASDPNSSRTGFNASLYDSRGLYFNGDNTPISGPNPVPSDSISTRISCPGSNFAIRVARVTPLKIINSPSFSLLSTSRASLPPSPGI